MEIPWQSPQDNEDLNKKSSSFGPAFNMLVEAMLT